MLAPHQPEPPTPTEWDDIGVFEILTDHAWIEAGETVSDEQLLDLGITQPTVLLFHARLGWRWSGSRKEIVVMAREILIPSTTSSITINQLT